MEKYIKYLLLAVIGTVFLSLPAGIPMIKSYSEYSSFNTDWDGCSKFTKHIYDSEIRITPIYSPYEDYKFDKNGILFIIGPEIGFSDFEIEKIGNFVKDGNTIIIADDFGTSNLILEKLDLPNKFTKNKLNDIFYISNENLIEYNVSEYYGGGVVVTNIPTYTAKEGVVTTSNFSKSGSKIGSLSLISEINYGNGKIILIADPDIFTNGLYEYNQNFLENFIAKLNSNHIYIDEIHHKDFGYEINVLYIQKSVPKEFTLVLMLILISLFHISNKKLFNGKTKKLISKFAKKRKENEEGILEDISENHGIDLNDLKRVIKNIKDGNNGRKRITK
ncbi:DUF4350 domain-containing protein [Methanococcus maripaludis]|uniref:DUF4350 domain-containing protein n=2 Tax=Methanococcus maripaludis TaxID=39152 RepID=A0A7J9PI24_METMI|nr:DUF4350 domain-containing protein [Methanococcus maripaludis]MBA2862310.1 hypothetical protein [Methanococcus maripaludis]